VLSKRFVYHQAGIPPGTQSFSEREMTLALPPGPHIEPTGFIFAGPPDVKEEERQPAKVSPILLTRTYNLDSHQVAQALKHNNPDGSTNTALALREFITGLGIDLDPPKTMFYRDQPGGLFVRVTPDDVE
jgi:hypothetical protein